MYIEPMLAGVIVTILAEMIIALVLVGIAIRKNERKNGGK